MDKDFTFNNLVDLHTHLGSSSTPEFLWEMAHEQGIKLPTKNYWKFINTVTILKKTTYDKYLDYFNLSELIQSSVWAVEKSVYDAISLSYRKANITTIELRFNPMLRNRNDEQDLDKIILAATIGMKKACIVYPVKAGLILMLDRRFNKKLNKIIAKKAVVFRKEGVVGIDLGGPDKKEFEIKDMYSIYDSVRSEGLKTTIHTGEVGSLSEMRNVVKNIQPDRIGHGIKAVSDPKLLNELANLDIPLELCPTSNIRTKAIKNWKEFESIIKILKNYNIKFTINSDGPVFLKTNVKNELEQIYAEKIMTLEEIQDITKLARQVSFIK